VVASALVLALIAVFARRAASDRRVPAEA
jgi:hypothetical protein